MQITSTANPLLKDVRRAVARGGFTEDGYCVAEGFHLLHEAHCSRVEIGCVLVAEGAFDRLPRLDAEVRTMVLPDALFHSIASTETSQGIAALVRLPVWSESDLLRGQTLVMVLDGVQDPGNAGAIVRAAEAFGATGVVFGQGSARPQNPKTLRASAGSLFRVPHLISRSWLQTDLRMFSAMPSGPGVPSADQMNLRERCSIVIGSEGQGVSEAYRQSQHIAIPTQTVESLNAAVAAAILLYEAQRQRSGRSA